MANRNGGQTSNASNHDWQNMAQSNINADQSGTIGSVLGGGRRDHPNSVINQNSNFLGQCAVVVRKDDNQMTQSQSALADYFNLFKKENLDYFNELTNIKFSDLFKFRGLLGSGSYGVVITV